LEHPDFVYTRRPNNSKRKAKGPNDKDIDAVSVQSPDVLVSPAEDLKRPMNAYLLFNKEMRAKLKQDNERKLSVAEISRAIGEKWKEMTEVSVSQVDRIRCAHLDCL
jgi:hypothetical protein